MKLKKVGLTIILLALAITVAVYAIQMSRIIHNEANVACVGINIYWDSECTQPCTSIDWGNLYPGDTKTQQLYIKNVENTPCTLTMATGNWTPPEAANYITLSWNYAGQTLNPSEVLTLTFTLQVSQQITGINKFQFDIIITATT